MSDNYLIHHGIKGQKWGVRKYQNLDGTLTEEGHLRYRKSNEDKITSDDKKKVKTILKNIIEKHDNGDSELEEIELMELIESKSVDYYNGVGVSPDSKKEIVRHDRSVKYIEKKINAREKEIKSKCGFPREGDLNQDLKFSKAVDKFLKISDKDLELKKMRSSLDTERTRYKNNLVKIVLRDFGIPITKQNMDAIYFSIISD